jgi:hypothetical protein
MIIVRCGRAASPNESASVLVKIPPFFKVFFFEKKNQKTFATWYTTGRSGLEQIG